MICVGDDDFGSKAKTDSQMRGTSFDVARDLHSCRVRKWSDGCVDLEFERFVSFPFVDNSEKFPTASEHRRRRDRCVVFLPFRFERFERSISPREISISSVDSSNLRRVESAV